MRPVGILALPVTAVEPCEVMSAHTARTWRPLLGPELARRAVDVAQAVGEAVGDPSAVRVGVADDAVRSTGGDVPWRDPSLAGGYPGLAVLSAYLDACYPGGRWARAGHAQLAAAVCDADVVARLGPALHGGWAGLAFAAASLAAGRTRYAAFLDQADAALAATAGRLAGRVKMTPPPIAPPLVDVISGLAGAAVGLLARRGRPDVDAALEATLSALTGLAVSVDGLPRMASPAQWAARSFGDSTGPMLNLGLAHGLPGVVAALALALREGVAVEGQDEAVGALVDLLLRHRQHDADGPVWPNGVPLAGAGPPPPTTRFAWCYGTPGCARALWLAGLALDRPEWVREAVDAFRGVLARLATGPALESPMFCHGRAGVVQLGLRFASEVEDASLANLVRAEAVGLLEAYEPASRYGFRKVDGRGRRRDAPGLLDGAAGVALVLLAAATDVQPAWDRAFLVT